MTRTMPRLTLWRAIVAAIFALGLYATYARFFLGFEKATNLTDPQPWGLWVGLGTLCGVGLSAGGFAIAAAVYLLGFERYRPVLRAAVLVSFLGYSSVIAGMMYELGLPWRIWHPIVMWNRHYLDIYGFPSERVSKGMSLEEIVKLSGELGNHPGHTPQQFLAAYKKELRNNRGGMRAKSRELLHGGRTTQVWDAKITNEDSGKLLAAFRCTQMILYPR